MKRVQHCSYSLIFTPLILVLYRYERSCYHAHDQRIITFASAPRAPLMVSPHAVSLGV